MSDQGFLGSGEVELKKEALAWREERCKQEVKKNDGTIVVLLEKQWRLGSAFSPWCSVRNCANEVRFVSQKVNETKTKQRPQL